MKKCSYFIQICHVLFFQGLLAFVMSNWKPVTSSLDYFEQLMLVLIKLRLGLLNEDLSYRFKIGKGTVSCIFREWIARMGFVLACFIKQSSRKTIKKKIPKCFLKANLGHVTSVIDCSEIFY